ncbi:DUF2059 domain-containing protein [Sphingobium ummariense]
MRRSALVIPLMLLASPLIAQSAAEKPQIAQTPSHLALADELVEVARVGELQMSVIPQLVEMIMPLVIRGNEGKADEVRRIVSEEMQRAFGAKLPELIRVTRDAYANNLTDQELRDLTAFYRSASGQRFIAMMPKITSESMSAGANVGRSAAQSALPVIIDRLQKANLKVPSRS